MDLQVVLCLSFDRFLKADSGLRWGMPSFSVTMRTILKKRTAGPGSGGLPQASILKIMRGFMRSCQEIMVARYAAAHSSSDPPGFHAAYHGRCSDVCGSAHERLQLLNSVQKIRGESQAVYYGHSGRR